MMLAMLRAIDSMLEGEESPNIKCARAVLAEIIKDQENTGCAKVAKDVIYEGPVGDPYENSDLDPEAAKAESEIMGD